MAVCKIFSPPKDLYSKETYDKVLEHLGDAFPPPAMNLHVMGSNDEGEVRIVDVFESAEEFQQFAETHMPVYEALGISLDDVLKYAQVFNIEKTIK
jgi:hypothetical protein